MSTYKELTVYKEARELYIKVYDAILRLPVEERFAMASQMRRASISITSNIAEGQGRGTIKDYIHFLYNSRGSAYELESQIIACSDLSLIDREILIELYNRNKRVIQLLNRMIDTLQEKVPTRRVNEEVETYGSKSLPEPYDSGKGIMCHNRYSHQQNLTISKL